MGAWGKPHRKYCVEFDEDTNTVLDAKLVEDKSTNDTNVFTLISLYHGPKILLNFRGDFAMHSKFSSEMCVLDSCG